MAYAPASDEMVITVHRRFANKSCPGEWLYSRLGDLAAKVTAALGGMEQTETVPAENAAAKAQLYRVRRSWDDSKTQKGAYKLLANAKKCADKNPGYFVFDVDGKAVYPAAENTPPIDPAFKVQIDITNLNIRTGPCTNFSTTGQFTGAGVFTITETRSGEGSAAGWGKLKSGAGWISLDFARKI